MGELAKIESFCELSTTNLSFKRDVSKEEWMDVFKALKQVEGCVQFWIGDCLAYRQQKWGMYDDIAEEIGYSKETLKQYKTISEAIEPCTRVHDLGYSHHREVAALPPEKQELFLNMAVDEGLSVRELRAKIRNERKEIKLASLPDEKYRIIYADPPWSYRDKQDISSLGGATKHYPTMSIDELCSMPIMDLAQDDAVLFLWVTSPLLNECFAVIEAWGFNYKTSFVWDKVKHNMGHYNSVRHELLLICTRGSCTPDNVKLFDSVQSIERNENHSEKPEYFREIIETLYTHGRKIELFARRKVEGWDVFGNEI